MILNERLHNLHYVTLIIALVALFISCFAITGYIRFRDHSIPPGTEQIKPADSVFLFDELNEYDVKLPTLEKNEHIKGIHVVIESSNHELLAIVYEGKETPLSGSSAYINTNT